MDTPIISIIMPCFNYGRFLRDAVNSLIGGPTCLGEFAPQTFQNFEIVIVNDASTDDTNEIALSLVDGRIKYRRNDRNIGTAATLNVGIQTSMGKLITFLSADDMMETTRLEKLYQAMMSNTHRAIYDDMRVFDGKERGDIWPMPDYDFDRVLYKTGTMHAGSLYSRVAWQEAGGYPELFKDGREDWAFNVALGAKGWCGIRVKEPLYLYRRQGQNRSDKLTGSQWRMTFLGRMQATFPNLYRGERPQMCCGNSNKRAAAAKAGAGGAAAKAGGTGTFNIGDEGMTLLEFQLPKAGHVTYIGTVTHQTYVFSSIRKRGYVDSRDASALLARIEDRRHAFIQVEEARQPVATPPLAEVAPAKEPAPALATEELVITETVPQAAQTLKPRKPRKSA
jgi:glycosyltransferase involved in cell wall biosynthesis